jgi:hypothetical protein
VLSVTAHADDAAVAQGLGWRSGIPGVELTLAPVDGVGDELHATTDAAGQARLNGLSQGKYLVTARRLLSDGERGRVVDASGAVAGAMAFVGTDTLRVSSVTGTSTIQIPVSYRGSLVISEVYQGQRLVVGLGSYMFGGYMELYNNADTTLFLDGVLISDALNVSSESQGSVQPCALLAPFRDDPAGVWTQWIAAFPGTGRSYPLAPGGRVVVATDAVDHTVLYPGMLDLRGAHFEFPGSADADNPAVPNMVDHGIRPPFFDHGQYFGTSLAIVSVVSRATDPSTFSRAKLPPNATEHMRIPRESILDAFTTTTQWFRTQVGSRVCPQLVNSGMDRAFGWLLGGDGHDWERSVSRRVLTTLPDGRAVLQNTRSSANDFAVTPITPREVQ